MTQADWDYFINTNRVPWGQLISRQLVASIPVVLTNSVATSPAEPGPITVSPPGAPDGPYVFMQFQSAFAEKQAAKEKVTLALDKDGQWRVASYVVR